MPPTIRPLTTPDPSRPFEVFVPSSYDAATPMPLVILLHGYSADGATQETYFQLQPLAEERGFLYVHPDGTVNPLGKHFWNATPACCGFRDNVDDVGYITGIIDQVSATYRVDAKRVFVLGHSNGGFMSHRMACDVADRVAAIVSLAGATFDDPSDCRPVEPVSVLEVHGTDDGTILYDGGQFFDARYPSAPDTVATWAALNGCNTTPTATDRTLDIDRQIDGEETSVEEFTGCPPGIAVELWTIHGGQHIPAIQKPGAPPNLSVDMLDFLFAHPKP